MATQYSSLIPELNTFIETQRIFFTATAAADSRINISPRSTDFFRILDENTAIYLDKTGSGNETAAHTLADGRMTIMFCAFEGPPRILRLYGRGDVIHRDSTNYSSLMDTWFPGEAPIGARQIIKLSFDLIQSSCGYAVPVFEFKNERSGLDQWAAAKSEDELEQYWRDENQTSMDGLPTGIFKNGE